LGDDIPQLTTKHHDEIFIRWAKTLGTLCAGIVALGTIAGFIAGNYFTRKADFETEKHAQAIFQAITSNSISNLEGKLSELQKKEQNDEAATQQCQIQILNIKAVLLAKHIRVVQF
jgi:hypothetical protein